MYYILYMLKQNCSKTLLVFFDMYDLALDTDIVDTNVIDNNINLYAGVCCRHYQGRILG